MFIEIIARFIEKKTSKHPSKSLPPAPLSGSLYSCWKQDKLDGGCTLVFIIDQLSRSSIIPRSAVNASSVHALRSGSVSIWSVGAQDTHAPLQHLLGVSYFRRGIPYA